MSFEGRTAVVTGAAGGIGLAICRALLAEGAHVVAIDVKAPKALARNVDLLRGSVADAKFMTRAMQGAYKRTGRLDYLINAAGVLRFGEDCSLADVDPGVWHQVLEVNLTGAMVAARTAIPHMRQTGGGAMVHISSTQALRGDDKPQDAYAASKAALIAMSKSIAIQFAHDLIRSNTVLPGPTETPLQNRWQSDPALKEATAHTIPLGRVGRPEDIADACLFLLSDRAAYITGTELIVDGGLTARP